MSSNTTPLCVLKLLVIGESGVGKSSIVQAYAKDTFDLHQSATIGLDFESKTVEVDGNFVKLAIWDTAGQERYRTLVPSFYRDAHGAILVYDVSRPETLSNLDYWYRELMAYSNKTNMVTLLVGNKIDKDRQVDKTTGAEFAQRHRMLFIECSALSKEGVNLAFEELIRKIIETPGLWISYRDQSVQLHKNNTNPEESTSCLGYSCQLT